jgi:hypothetical protein
MKIIYSNDCDISHSVFKNMLTKKKNNLQKNEKLKEPKRCTDRLCGLVARAPGYRSRGPGSIPGTTTFSEKQWVWNGVRSAS